jgi:hypothetical protein
MENKIKQVNFEDLILPEIEKFNPSIDWYPLKGFVMFWWDEENTYYQCILPQIFQKAFKKYLENN